MESTTETKLRDENAQLISRCDALLRQLEDALVANDTLKLQLEAARSAPVLYADDLAFDDTKPYRLTASFAAVIGTTTMRFPRGKIIDDPFILRRLNENGAKMARV